MIETKQFSDAPQDHELLRRAVAPRLLELGDESAAFRFARLGGDPAGQVAVRMLRIVNTRECAEELARLCTENGSTAVLAVAHQISTNPVPVPEAAKIAFVSTVLALAHSQPEIVIALTALCPVIAQLQGVSELQKLGSVLEEDT